MMQPTAELLAKLPDIAASNWEQRKERIAADRKQLSTRLNDETLLNRKAIAAKLKGELSEEDFQAVKAHIAETTASIHEQLKALESERCTLEDLMADAQHDIVNLAKAWLNAGINERQELQNTLFPEGLRFSPVCIHCRIQPMAEPPFGLVGWSAEADTPLRRKSWRVAIGASTLPPSA